MSINKRSNESSLTVLLITTYFCSFYSIFSRYLHHLCLFLIVLELLRLNCNNNFVLSFVDSENSKTNLCVNRKKNFLFLLAAGIRRVYESECTPDKILSNESNLVNNFVMCIFFFNSCMCTCQCLDLHIH